MNVIEVHIDNQRNASVQKVRAILPYKLLFPKVYILYQSYLE